ncbi:MAG: DNA-3-methyladenine glycosylase 2 family protein [Oscillospiraceae bacterium]|nr:DNA-3-methyladenine glycosylase 2 family protein [Oscillospiraceae bacterium]
MKTEKTPDGIKITDISGLSLPETLDCGQCFRWKADSEGNWCGVVKGIYRKIRKEKNGITILGADEQEFEKIWFDYFDFGRDYDALKADFSANEMIKAACEFAPGIRVLRQEPWEAFITFIISQNNNIARIKGIVERLCAAFGEEIEEGIYSFPTAQRLAAEPAESFAKIGCGYRADYISFAAKEVYEGRLVLEELMTAPIAEARERLLKVHGVGPKVADCVLLYGLGRAERCPADVWMKRVIAALGGEMPQCVTDYAGIAQQFLFHYARNFPEKFVGINTK